MITIPASAWQQVRTAMEKVTQQQEKLQKEYLILCDQAKQYAKHVENIEPKGIQSNALKTIDEAGTPHLNRDDNK